MGLPHTHGTQGRTKHDKLNILWRRSMWWILLQWCISLLIVFNLCDFTFSEDLEIFLIPAHILNFFSRPCSNVYYIHINAFIYIYTYICTESKYGFRRKKLVTCMCIFLLSHRFVKMQNTDLCFLYDMQAVVFEVESSTDHWSSSLIAKYFK